MTINGVHTVNPRQTIHYQLLLAAYMHGKRNAVQRILEEIENGSDVL
jgi:hypothetical protein